MNTKFWAESNYIEYRSNIYRLNITRIIYKLLNIFGIILLGIISSMDISNKISKIILILLSIIGQIVIFYFIVEITPQENLKIDNIPEKNNIRITDLYLTGHFKDIVNNEDYYNMPMSKENYNNLVDIYNKNKFWYEINLKKLTLF